MSNIEIVEKIDNYLSDVYHISGYPVLANQAQKWVIEHPLNNISILDAAPIVRNCMLMYKPLLLAGAKLTLGRSPQSDSDFEIVELMKSFGIDTLTPDEVEDNQFDIIADCAGVFSKILPKIGYVELTKSGAHKYQNASKPVFLADGGRVKHIETCLGTGEAYFRAMEQLGYTDWKDKVLVVFGSGKVGTGIMYNAKQHGVYVKVITESSSITPLAKRYCDEIIDYHDTPKILEAINSAYAAVTATGVEGAVSQVCPPKAIINSNAILANMGAEDEYGRDIPQERVINDKHSLNFILKDPTQVNYIDATLALRNEGIVYLLANKGLKKGILYPPEEIENDILHITRLYGVINDQLDAISIN